MFRARNFLIAIVLVVCALRGFGLYTRSKARSSPGVVTHGQAAEPEGKGQGEAKSDPGAAVRLQLHRVMDTEGSGGLAYTFLLPEGWTSEDRLHWLVDNYTTPVVGFSLIKSEDGREEIDSVSGVATSFSHGPAGDSGMPPPRSLSQYLLSDWKRRHPGLNFQVTSREDTPIDVSGDPNVGFGKVSAQHGLVKLSFRRNGQIYLSKVQARMDTFRTNSAPTAIGGEIYEGGWRISSQFTVTAPAAEFDHAMRTCALVLTSSKTDPHFFSRVAQAQKVIQARFYDMQNRIRETSQLISQTNDEISDSIMSSYNTSQAAADHEAANFDDYIRGVDKYSDASGPIDLPSGYAHAWADNQGHYIVSDQGLYDPNVSGPGGTWQELEKKP